MKTSIVTYWQEIVAAAVTIVTTTIAPNATYAQVLRGSGDSFAEPLYQRYIQEYQQQTGETFNYTTVGSGGGTRLFINQSIDFGGTSLIPTPIEQNQMQNGLLMVPTAGGSISVIYNLKDVNTNVKLSRDKLAKIFTGQISNWQQINSRFPNKKIQVVVCADSCSTSFILTKYLQAITEGEIAASRDPNWGFEVFESLSQDSAIAGEVKRTDGAIGYVQTNVARVNNISIASLENKTGRYVSPSLEETKIALDNIQFKDDFTTEDIFDPEDGYPLVSLTWLLIYKQYLDPELLTSTQNLLNWILTEGQEFNEELEYTKIPEDVTTKVIEAVNTELRVRPY